MIFNRANFEFLIRHDKLYENVSDTRADGIVVHNTIPCRVENGRYD